MNMDEQIVTEPDSVQALNVELLGKPIHIIKNKLEAIINSSQQYLTNELQAWLKTPSIHVELTDIQLNTLGANLLDSRNCAAQKHATQGVLYVSVEPMMLMRLSDEFYGAGIERSQAELTNSDVRLLQRISKHVANWIAPNNTWQTQELETLTGIGIVATLTIQMQDKQAPLTMVLDSDLIQTLVSELELTANPELASEFCQALHTTPVKLNVQLSKNVMPLTEVLDLKPDDILPIELLNHAPVNIGKQTLFTGRVAEQDGQLVLILNEDKETHR